jgi:hypothetical protein
MSLPGQTHFASNKNSSRRRIYEKHFCKNHIAGSHINDWNIGTQHLKEYIGSQAIPMLASDRLLGSVMSIMYSGQGGAFGR